MSKKFQNWFLSKEGSKFSIRRYVFENGVKRSQRYPSNKYKHLTEEELVAFVDRLNYRNRKAEEAKLRFHFLGSDLLESFRDQLRVNIPNTKDFNYTYSNLFIKKFLGFFVGELKLVDPLEWSKHQEKWAAHLLAQKYSPKTIKYIVQVGNRFLEFLHLKQPSEYHLIKLKPLGTAALKHISASKSEKIGKFISDDHWKLINSNLPTDVAPFIRLMYFYGLRRSESLGFSSTESVKKGHLLIEYQRKSASEGFSALKDRESRKTPHWFCTPALCYSLVEASIEPKMHPDVLSQKFDLLMSRLKLPYRTHDLRRTFITKALREKNSRDVQLAVGHADLRTTMKYAQDDRNLENEVWKPSG